jgi:rRNA maturation protein Nop10
MKYKVGVIIAIQISIIASSFLVLSIYQNQSTYLGNTINTSGKDRYLAELLYARTISYLQSDNQTPPIDVIRNIDANVYSLSHGGILPPQVLYPIPPNGGSIVISIPPEFSNDFKQVQDKWAAYRTETSDMFNSKGNGITSENIAKLQNENSAFIVADDNLTADLSTYSKQQSQNLIMLQISFLIVNVFTHFFLLRIILKIIKHDYARGVFLNEILSNQKQLVSESRLSTLQKDILECFLGDMTEDIHKLKKQVHAMEDPVENENNKITLLQITDTLLTRMNQLAESKKELEDQKSYYRHLNKKLEKSISVLSKDGKKIEIKNTEDLIAVMQSYVDRINILAQTQKLPPHLEKNLTKAIEEIIDYLAITNYRK